MAVGTDKGFVQIWDVAMNKRITTLDGHSARVGRCFLLHCHLFIDGFLCVLIIS